MQTGVNILSHSEFGAAHLPSDPDRAATEAPATVQHDPVTVAGELSGDWTRDAAVKALILDIRANPPVATRTYVSSMSSRFGRVEVSTYQGDDRVAQLELIRDECCERSLEQAYAGDTSAFDLYYSLPDVDTFVDIILGAPIYDPAGQHKAFVAGLPEYLADIERAAIGGVA